MISRLSLVRYGKFTGDSFPLGETTLFLGENESGKSTLFDALLEKLCSPKGTTKIGKLLRARYGDARAAELDFEGDPIVMDAEEYLSLFAIRSSDLELNLEAGSDWLSKVKSKLFSGGVDPDLIARRLEAEASTNAGRKHMKQMASLDAERLGIETNLQAMKRRREELLGRERTVQGTAERLAEIERKLAEQAAKVKELESFIEQQSAIAERASLRELLARIGRMEELRRDEQARAPFRRDESQALQTLEKEIIEGVNAGRNAVERRRELLEKRDGFERTASALGARSSSEKRWGETATGIRRTLEAARSRKAPGVAFWLAIVGSAVLGAVLGALLLPLFVSGIGPAVSAVCGAVLFAVVALAVAIVVRTGASSAAPDLKRARDEWRLKAADAPPLSAETYEGMLGELHERERDAEDSRKKAEDAVRERDSLDELIRGAAAGVESSDRSLAAARGRLSEWLKARGALDSDGYRARQREYMDLSARIASGAEEINAALTRIGARDEAELKTECLVRVHRLDELITERPSGQEEVRRATAELADLRASSTELTAEKLALVRAVAGGLGEVRGSLGDLPSRILDAERDLARTSAQIARIELGRRAADLAREIFAEMSKDSSLLLSELAQHMGGFFGELVAAQRDVTIDQLDIERAAVADAGGELRPIDQLSHGTRDAFLLAARLTLAARARQGDQAVLVLDDPFLALDSARVAASLAFLSQFQERTKWQVILFSKDGQIEEPARRAFPRLAVVRLTSPRR